jgi:hypothetical protein
MIGEEISWLRATFVHFMKRFRKGCVIRAAEVHPNCLYV